MTRKDFLLISSTIATTVAEIRASQGLRDTVESHIPNQLRGIRRIAYRFADALKREHGERFDAQRFLTDCGFGETK